MHPPASNAALADARVLVVGLGGLGAPAAATLAEAGVGMLGLVDPDRVELSNLPRQPLYGDGDVGRPKVEAARERLHAMRGDLVVETWAERFEAGHAALAARFDVVLDGTDSIAAKFMLSDTACATRVPLVHAGALGFRAQVLTILPGETACYRCIFEEPPPPDDVPSCQEAGVMGPAVNLAGTLQAADAVRLLVGERPAFAGRLLTIDTRTGTWRSVPVSRYPGCSACARIADDAAIGRSCMP
jgi:adenylyltransferase/sulfurtransferase